MQIDQTNSYAPPVNQLLTYGKTQAQLPEAWPNYLELGLGPEHIPDLIRMLADEELNAADTDIAGWAPMHAYRALGQLHAETAIEPLLSMLEIYQDINDFAIEELPYVFAMIGPAALPKTFEYIADNSHNEWAHICAIGCVENIGLAWPEVHSECVTFLMTQLELFAENDYGFNTFLIDALVKLQALEAAPLIERAFAANRVDEMVMGDWDDIQVSLGLKSAEEVQEKRTREQVEQHHHQQIDFPLTEDEGIEYASANIILKSKTAIHKKVKNKMAKQSRKKNRRR